MVPINVVGMNTLEILLSGVAAEPQAEHHWLVLADWLEENSDPRRAELLRLHRRLLTTWCDPDSRRERTDWQAAVAALLHEGVKPCLPQRTASLGDGVAMDFSLIPPGGFLRGSRDNEDGREGNEALHRVEVTRGFWLGVFPMTWRQWRVLGGTCPRDAGGDDNPVEGVTWDECMLACRRLGEIAGLRARLPTEAEWEYACRAGSMTAYYTGEDLEAAARAGWCNHDGTWGTGRKSLPGYLDYGQGAATKQVGRFDPNAWGLYDMHGNVWEWCSDWYERDLGPGKRIDPVGPSHGTRRVLRGGSYWNEPPKCCSASRQSLEPDLPGIAGCRICLELDEVDNG